MTSLSRSCRFKPLQFVAGFFVLIISGCTAQTQFMHLNAESMVYDGYEVWEGHLYTQSQELPLSIIVTIDHRVYSSGIVVAVRQRDSGQLNVTDSATTDASDKYQYITSFGFNLLGKISKSNEVTGTAFGHTAASFPEISMQGNWSAPVSGSIDWKRGKMIGHGIFDYSNAVFISGPRDLRWEVYRRLEK